jgi:serine phosphatase RsbU (regulator of sigma subunit)
LIGAGIPDAAWETAIAPLPPNSGVLFYTDGVPDAAGDHGPFGIQRLEEAIARHRGGGLALLDGLLGSIDAFTRGHPLNDDLTLLTASIGLPGLG